MADLINQSDDAAFWAGYSGLLGAGGWASSPRLTSSDVQTYRLKDFFSADARDASRSNPYGRSAVRAHVDFVIGVDFKLQLEPDADVLGVDPDVALDWAEMVEQEWERYANSVYCPVDAQRKQNFTGLMRTAYASFYVSGETLATIEWKSSHHGDRTCLHLLQPERLSDPHGMPDWTGKRRMGVEVDQHLAPVAYHIRERHLSDSMVFGRAGDMLKWRRVPRYNRWGRQNVIHFYEHDQADMTRGLSTFTSAILPMRMLNDYVSTELESAAVRATYAAVIESEVDYEEAMKIIGPEYSAAINNNTPLQMQLKVMSERLKYYRGQDFHFGKSKVAHLLPNENLKMVQGTQSAAAVKDYNNVTLYQIAAALGVDFASLTKNYSETNYSGARAALYDVWRSYEVRRDAFIRGVGLPLFGAWLEERVALRETIPMLGNKSFYEARDALVKGTFGSWGKPRLDPKKENEADKVLYERGAISLREMCAQEGRDYSQVLRERAREKQLMDKLGLKPEDIDWTLIMNEKKVPGAKAPKTGG